MSWAITDKPTISPASLREPDAVISTSTVVPSLRVRVVSRCSAGAAGPQALAHASLLVCVALPGAISAIGWPMISSRRVSEQTPPPPGSNW